MNLETSGCASSFNSSLGLCLVSAANRLPQVAKAVSHSLNNCVNCLPGQKDVDMALKSIGEASKKLLIETVSLREACGNLKMTVAFFLSWLFQVKMPPFLSFQIPPASKSFQEAQSELNQTAAGLNQSAGEVVHASRGTSSQLAVASGKFSQDFDEFLDAGIEMAGHTQVGSVLLDVSLPPPPSVLPFLSFFHLTPCCHPV